MPVRFALCSALLGALSSMLAATGCAQEAEPQDLGAQAGPVSTGPVSASYISTGQTYGGPVPGATAMMTDPYIQPSGQYWSGQQPHADQSYGQQPMTHGGFQSPPHGMARLPSQGGNVFGAHLEAGPAAQLAEHMRQTLRGYFDAELAIIGQQSDPSGSYAQIGFSSSKAGAPVMGMIVVSPGPNGLMNGALLVDRADQFQQTGPAMMAALGG